ncbi:TetR family transcriptional regulator [Streptomyces sp. NPDC055749]
MPRGRRLLNAAAVEFAAHGIAGARVDRISVDGKVSKAQMHAYFGSKESPFDAVLADQVEGILDAAPLTADDLPGYAVRLYDAYLAHPQLVRLATWARLERTPAGHSDLQPWRGTRAPGLAGARVKTMLPGDPSASPGNLRERQRRASSAGPAAWPRRC